MFQAAKERFVSAYRNSIEQALYQLLTVDLKPSLDNATYLYQKGISNLEEGLQ